uniref:Uncharacterized protein n=1 Tax=Solanum tuberosum TaxID=4113 RepID=M1DKV1_SOLTU
MAMDNYVNHHWMENVPSPLAPAVAPTLFHNLQPQWSLLPHFNPPVNSNPFPQLPFFTPQEAINNNPLFFPWVPVPVQGHATQIHPQASMENHQTPIWQAGSSHQPPLWQEESVGQKEVARNSFTEISTLRYVSLILFPEKEDKKYIHMCQWLLRSAPSTFVQR